MQAISNKALEVIKLTNKAISNSITGVSFLSIRNYTNANNETANHLINIGINYDKSKKEDIILLENLNLKEYTFKSDYSLLEEARQLLIQSLIKPNEAISNAQNEAYTHIAKGLKVHNETGKLYIYGYRVNKTIITPGSYKEVKSKPLTIAKDELRKLLKTNKFVNMAVEVGNVIKTNGETIEI